MPRRWPARSPRSTTTTCRLSTARVAWPGSSPGPMLWPRSSPAISPMERAVARIDLGAVERNCARLKAELSAASDLWAVVRADGYGHGPDAGAPAGLAGGATRLAVATGAEA